MAWTPAPRAFPNWTQDTTTSSSWSPNASPYAAWDIKSSTGNTRRITQQDGRVRITEAGVIRIIDRFELHWTMTTSPPNSWHPS